MTSPTVEERLLRLERQNRRLRAGTLGMVCVVAISFLLGANQSPSSQAQPRSGPQTVTAGEFRLVDAKGNIRARLCLEGMNEDEGCLILYDRNDIERANLYIFGEHTGLTLRDGKAEQRLDLYESATGPGMALRDEEGKVRAQLAMNKGNPWLRFFDTEHVAIWGAPR